MVTSGHTPAHPPHTRLTALGLANTAILFIIIGLHFFMTFHFEVNWDEFFRLGRIYEWQNGTLNAIFETSYIHLFKWLNLVHQNEVYQIIAGRTIIFLLLLYACFIIFLISKHLFNAQIACIILICFLSFSFVFRHATSFRIDLLIIAPLLSVIWLLICSKKHIYHFFLAGALLGLAGAISVKSIFYVPTIACLLLINWWQMKWRLKGFISGFITAASSTLVVSILIFLHSQTFHDPGSASKFLLFESNSALIQYGLFPQEQTLVNGVRQNILICLLLMMGLLLAISDFIKNENRPRALILLSLMLPLMSLVFYVHTYVYFYTYLLASASIIVGLALSRLEQHYSNLLILVPFAVALSGTGTFLQSFQQSNAYQKQINSIIHEMFPSPVNYIDRTSQISSFPKQGLFMTVLQMDTYYAHNKAVFPTIFEKTPPEFLIANIDSLDLDNMKKTRPTRRLLAEDEDLLINNFIHHWGPIYVPGKEIKGRDQTTKITMKLAGQYTLEADSPISIEGTVYNPSDVINFDKSDYTVETKENESVVFRWGNHLYRPDFAPKGTKVFRGF